MNPVEYNPVPDPTYQARQDAEHLNLLSLFYYIAAGLFALGGLVFIFHIVMGLAIASGAMSHATNAAVTANPNTFPGAPSLPSGGLPTKNAPPPDASGWIFVGMGLFALITFETIAAFTYLAGRSLARREKKTLIQVVAGILCLNMPLGTALGVFTFVVLGRPSVAAQFEAPRSP
ncbi:hypothetical protein IAD21_01695 [Abditibacteriota bacterium]|nr:hypothetical protein IAD21_01695 [Abditibacteriota bacterium]